MKKVMIIMVLGALAAYLVPAQAQTFQATTEKAAIQSQQMVSGSTSYKGTVYEPFTTTTPSEQSAVGASYSPAKMPGGPRKLGTPGDTNPSEASPIGDAILPLMAMLMVYGVWCMVYRRRRREEA